MDFKPPRRSEGLTNNRPSETSSKHFSDGPNRYKNKSRLPYHENPFHQPKLERTALAARIADRYRLGLSAADAGRAFGCRIL